MEQIYLDMNQCSEFRVAYFEPDEFSARASSILLSKRQGYDQIHRECLEPLGENMILLSRSRDDNPGWYTINKEKQRHD